MKESKVKRVERLHGRDRSYRKTDPFKPGGEAFWRSTDAVD